MPYKNKNKQKEYQRIWARKRMESIVNKTNQRRREYKIKLVQIAGGKCSRCGYDKCMDALAFHHKKGSEKEGGVGKLISNIGWKKLKKEIEKCELLCANCHFEHHSKNGYKKDK